MPTDYYTGRLADIDRKANLIADTQLERARRDVREMRRRDSLDQEEARERARKHRDRCVEHQAAYEERFARHGVKTPAAVADDTGPSYRRRLFGVAQTLLPDGDAMTKFDPRDLDGTVIVPMEAQLFEALDREAESPSGSNLPLSPDHPKAMREVTDSMGGRKTEFHARESFIKDMGRQGRRVLRLLDPRNGKVLLGAPWSTPPG
jgi:hypothetical protein